MNRITETLKSLGGMKAGRALSTAVVVALVAVAGFVVGPLRAADITELLLFDSGTGAVTGLTEDGKAQLKDAEDLSIPGEINGVKVTAIGDSAFKAMKFKKVTLPESVTTLGEYAFYGNGITELSAPGVTTVKAHALQLNALKTFTSKTLTEVGDSAFAQNALTNVDLSQAPATIIGESAFKDNKISSLSLPSGVTTIKAGAFSSNSLTSITLPESVQEVGDKAFSSNSIHEATVGTNVSSWGSDVFSGAGRYVKVVTENQNITTQGYSDGFGQVVNPVTVRLHLKDAATGQEISSVVTMSQDLTKQGEVFGKGTQARVTAPEIDGYKANNAFVDFTPDSDPYDVDVTYTKGGGNPVITVSGKPKSFKQGQQVTKADLLKDVSATDVNGQNITSSITVEPETLDTSTPGTKDVFYTATDSQGNQTIKKVVVAVGTDFGEIEMCNGWKVKDFAFDGTAVIGLSSSGQAKVRSGNTKICFPSVTKDGRTVESIGSGDTPSYQYLTNGITAVEDWGSATSLKKGFFSDLNRLESLPETWGNITSIGKSVFEGASNLTSIPNTWGKVTSLGDGAFNRAGLTKIPDQWPAGMTYLPKDVFKSNKIKSVPESWGDIKDIGNGAFGYQDLTADDTFKVPNWTGVTSIGDQAFASTSSNNRAKMDLPASFETVRSIGWAAFEYAKGVEDKITDWGDVETIGANAFYRSDLTSLPDSWGKVNKLGNEAFAETHVAKIPDNWGNLTTIPNGLFSNVYDLTTIPSSWGNVTKIDDYAFSKTRITEIPDSWGEVTWIGNGALNTSDGSNSNNGTITKVPSSWGKVNVIRSYAINSAVSSYPSDWSGIRLVEEWALRSKNQKSAQIVTASDALLSRDRPKREGGYTGDTNQKVYMYPADGTFPDNIPADTDNIFAGPTFAKIRYVDENGNDIRPAVSTKMYPRGTVIKPVSVYGFETPGDYTAPVSTSADEKEIVFTYKRSGPVEQKTSISISKTYTDSKTGVTTDTAPTVNAGSEELAVTVKIGNSGANAEDIPEDTTIRIPISDAMTFSGIGQADRVKSAKVVGNEIVMTLKALPKGTDFSVPVRFKFNRYKTAANTAYPMSATMVYPDDTARGQSNTVDIYSRYENPVMRKGTVENGNEENMKWDGYLVDDYTANADGSVASGDQAKNYLTYTFYVTNLHRNIGAWEVTDTLPTYKKADGSEAKAVFDPALNPGWSLSDDGTTAVYHGSEAILDTDSKLLPVTLRLRYPDAANGANIKNSADIRLTPHNKGAAEKDLHANNSITNSFVKFPEYKGVGDDYGSDKYASGPECVRARECFFSDTTRGRSMEQKWNLVAYSKGESTPRFTDHDLDPRLRYTALTNISAHGNHRGKSHPDTLDGADVMVVDQEGATLWTAKMPAAGSRLDIPEEYTTGQVSVIIKANKKMKNSTAAVIVHTELRDKTSKVVTEDPTTAIMRNSVTTEMDGGYKVTREANLRVIPESKKITATKTSSFASPTVTGDTGSYNVGFKTDEGFGATIENFRMVDLLPAGLSVVDYTMSNIFEQSPGARVDAVSNYNNTGRTAVIWTADSIPASTVTNNTMAVGAITAKVSGEAATGRITNDVYLTSTTEDMVYGNKVDNPPTGNGTWSKAEVSDPMLAAEDLSTVKEIRNLGGAWSKDITTYAGEQFEYRLAASNMTNTNRTSPVFYDFFPHVGDTSVTGDPRLSEFANTWDLSRQPVLPDRWRIQYLNTDSNPPVVTQSNRDAVLESLNWSDTPAANTKGIRVSGPVIEARTTAEVILPMKAPEEHVDGIAPLPYKNLYKVARNTFMYDDDQSPFLLEPAGVVNRMEAPGADIKFKKVSNFPGGPLAGAKFVLKDDKGKTIGSATSGKDGMVKFVNKRIKPGYTITEIHAPKGYKVTSKPITIGADKFINMVGRTYVIDLGEMSNSKIWAPIKPMTGEVRFTKIGKGEIPLPGATFQLKGTSGATSGLTYTAVSNSKGTVSFKNVPLGRYSVSEVSAPGRFVKTDRTWDVALTKANKAVVPDGMPTSGVINDRVNVRLVKIGVTEENTNKKLGEYTANDGTKVPGISFDVLDPAGKVVASGTTGALWSGNDGVLELKNLETGVVYTLKEKTSNPRYENFLGDMRLQVSPTGDLLDGDGAKMKIQSDLYVPNLLKNVPSQVVITKHKYGDKTVKVEGTEFALYSLDSTGAWVAERTATTGQDGTVSFTGLTGSKYKITETRAAKGYLNDGWSQVITTDPNRAKTFSYEVADRAVKAKVVKTETLGTGLSQVQAERLVSLSGKPGRVVQDGSTYRAELLLPGAEFDIKDSSGTVIEHVVTGQDGTAEVTSVLDEKETYTAVETKAPYGYSIKGTGSKSFRAADYAARSDFKGTIDVSVDNFKEHGRITVSKIDATTGKALAGAGFDIKDHNGKVVRSVVTDSTGISSITGLEFGSYTVTETAAPKGYRLDPEPKPVTVTPEDANGQVVVKDSPVLTSFSFTKVNTAGNPLADAEFNLVKDCAGVQDCAPYETTLKSDSKGNVKVSNVETNRVYTITEVKAPEGYNLLSEPVKVTVGPDGVQAVSKQSGAVFDASQTGQDGDSHFTVVNYTEGQLPLTGSPLTDWWKVWTTTGALVLAAGTALVYAWSLRRREN